MISKRKPSWLKSSSSLVPGIKYVDLILDKYSVSSVCREARCPNIGECFSNKTATFLIMGKVCTRNCRFCNISNGNPYVPDRNEPIRISLAIKELGINYAVITSVSRDDLEDGGAEHFKSVIDKIRELNRDCKIEVLVPDFRKTERYLDTVINSVPDVINHNLETIPTFYKRVMPQADYDYSLYLLQRVKESSEILTKSGILLGLGEEINEVIELFRDLRNVNCDLLTISQYIPPTKSHYPVKKYVDPDVFDNLKQVALDMGFKGVMSGPLVRSSYNSEKLLKSIRSNNV